MLTSSTTLFLLLGTAFVLLTPVSAYEQREPTYLHKRSISTNTFSKTLTLKILQGTFTADYNVLEFQPYANPPSLKVASSRKTSDGYIKGWMTAHPKNSNIILACDQVANGDGYMASYRVNRKTGKLSFLDAAPTNGTRRPGVGASTAHCSFLANGKVAAAANYGAENVATYKFNYKTGKFGKAINDDDRLDWSGYVIKPGQLPDRQNYSFPHQVIQHPFLPFVYIPDLGADLLRVFNIDRQGIMTNETQYEQVLGSGPRHATVTSDGKHLYVVHEMSAAVTPYKIDLQTGQLKRLQDDLTILPNGAVLTPAVTGAEVHASPDGQFLYASTRNSTSSSAVKEGDPDDVVTVFSIGHDGCLKKLESVEAPGARVIRSCELSPAISTHSAQGQDYLIAGGQNSGTVTVFSRNSMTGLLDVVAQLEGVDQPSTFVWL